MEAIVYVFLAVLSILFLLPRIIKKPPQRLPPGPWQLPIIGSLHHLLLGHDSSLPHRAMQRLAQKHGPVMLLKLGEVPIVVISSAEALKEITTLHDAAFSSRTLNPTFQAMIQDGGTGVFLGDHGDYWRRLRKIYMQELLSGKQVKSSLAMRENEVGGLLRSIASPPGPLVNLSQQLEAFALDTGLRNLIGDRIRDHKRFIAIIQEGLDLAGDDSLVDLFPSSALMRVVSRVPARGAHFRKSLLELTRELVEERQTSRAADGRRGDFLDVLVQLQKEDGLQDLVSTELLPMILFELYAAGGDVWGSLQWAMADLLKNPKVMQKAQQEVRQEFEREGKVDAGALDHLTYLQLVIKESLRLHCPGASLLRRC